MGRTIGIIVLIIIVLGLAWLAYKFIFKKPEDGTACDSDGDGVNDGTYLDGVCIKTDVGSPGYNGPHIGNVGQGGNLQLDPSLNPVHVAKNKVAAGPNPLGFYNNINTGNLSNFNILGSNISNPGLIYFTTRFDSQCPSYVWYNKWLYVFVNEKISQATGPHREDEKNCYYRLDRSIFPNEFKVQLPSPVHTCPALKLFISGIQYSYSETRSEFVQSAQGGSWKSFCIYKRSS